jgi:hypothetical protein
MQTPEEERQRLELEQRLFAQGRGGVQTAQYGGTPEQLAMAKAQAEAQNQAGLMAMQQAGTEEQAALNRALSLSGQAGQFAGMSSDLQSASQQRGAQLAQLGMSSEQIQSQLASEGLSRASGAAGVSGQLATTGDQLRSSAQNRAMQLSQMGMSAEQIQSQLQSEGLSRAGSSAGLASSLAGQASNLESAGGSELEQEYYKTAAGLFGQQAGGKQGLLGQLLGGGKLSQSVQDQIEAMITGGQGSIF